MGLGLGDESESVVTQSEPGLFTGLGFGRGPGVAAAGLTGAAEAGEGDGSPPAGATSDVATSCTSLFVDEVFSVSGGSVPVGDATDDGGRVPFDEGCGLSSRGSEGFGVDSVSGSLMMRDARDCSEIFFWDGVCEFYAALTADCVLQGA